MPTAKPLTAGCLELRLSGSSSLINLVSCNLISPSGNQTGSFFCSSPLLPIDSARVASRLSEMHMQEFNGRVFKKLGDRFLGSITLDYIGPQHQLIGVASSNRGQTTAAHFPQRIV